MIELTREDFSMIIMDIIIGVAYIPRGNKTDDFIQYLWECYKDNKHIITIGVK